MNSMKSLRPIVLLFVISSMVAAQELRFESDIAPILDKYCVGCHSADEPEADLRLDSFELLMKGGENGKTISASEPAKSLLLARVTGEVEPIMPPEDEPRPSKEELKKLIAWVTSGARGPEAGDGVSHPKFDQIEPVADSAPITAVAHQPNSDNIAIAHFGEVKVFSDLAAEPKVACKTQGKVHALRFDAQGAHLAIASGIAGLQGEAILLDVDSGKVLQRYAGHNDSVYAIAISADAKLVATGSYDRQIIVWDAKSGERLRTLRGHNGAIYDLAFSPDAKVLVSASADTTVKVWNVATGERLDTLGQPLKELYSVDVSPDGQHVIAGGEDNRIRMWSLVSIDEAEINPIEFARFAHESAIEQVRYSPDGNYIVSSSVDRKLKIWSADSLELLNAIDLADGIGETFSIANDSRSIDVVEAGQKLRKFTLQSSDAVESGIETATQQAAPRHRAPQRAITDSEPNNTVDLAQRIRIPAKVTGKIFADSVDSDVFRFGARAGEVWIIEVKAARDKSPLDSHIAVLHDDGTPVPRVQLQAVRDSYFTFRGKDSNTTGDFRLHNWEEMRLNQFLYSQGEVVKLYHYPRGPDSGFNVYPNFGNRRTYFDSTPIAHALHEPAYVVEPHPPGASLPPNGLPVFTLNYENDDDSERRFGKDSRLTFTVPKDGEYLIKLRDVRGLQGDDFAYELFVRAPKPDFKCKVATMDPKVGPGTGRKIMFEAERIDGFEQPINIRVSNLPDGFSIVGPLQIEAGHDRAWATLLATDDAVTPDEDVAKQVEITASTEIDGELIVRDLGSLGQIEVSDSPKLLVELTPDVTPSRGHKELPVVELRAGTSTTATIRITRIDHDGRVGFGSEDGAVNAPHGVYVDNIGLNGVLIVEGQNERQFFITAEPWVQPMERVIFVQSDVSGNPTSNPVLLRILPPDHPQPTDQASN